MPQDYYDALIRERGEREAAHLLADECRKKDQAIVSTANLLAWSSEYKRLVEKRDRPLSEREVRLLNGLVDFFCNNAVLCPVPDEPEPCDVPAGGVP